MANGGGALKLYACTPDTLCRAARRGSPCVRTVPARGSATARKPLLGTLPRFRMPSRSRVAALPSTTLPPAFPRHLSPARRGGALSSRCQRSTGSGRHLSLPSIACHHLPLPSSLPSSSRVNRVFRAVPAELSPSSLPRDRRSAIFSARRDETRLDVDEEERKKYLRAIDGESLRVFHIP